MVLDKSDIQRVLLVAGDLIMEQESDMSLFYITEHHLINTNHPRGGVSMKIKFKRKIMGEMMTTYLPSILLMMITFATTFFKPHLIEAALGVNLTTMLVMTNIFISKMESLPPTSDIKMIDIWLILCQLVPFAQVVLLTAMEFFREEENEKEVERVDEDPHDTRVKANGPDDTKVVLNANEEAESNEAWVSMNAIPVQADTVQKLLTVGRRILRHSSYLINKNIS